MKFNLGVGSIIFLTIAATVVIFWDDIKKSFFSSAAAVGQAVNPLSDQNLANKATNAIVQNITGDVDATLGTKIFDTVQGISDWLKMTGTGVPDVSWLEPGVKEFCQRQKDKGIIPSPGGACEWLENDGRLVDNNTFNNSLTTVDPITGLRIF